MATVEAKSYPPAHRRRGPQPIPRPPAAELRRLYVTERLSLEDIGRRYSVSAWTVQHWLRSEQIHRERPRRRLLSCLEFDSTQEAITQKRMREGAGSRA